MDPRGILRRGRGGVKGGGSGMFLHPSFQVEFGGRGFGGTSHKAWKCVSCPCRSAQPVWEGQALGRCEDHLMALWTAGVRLTQHSTRKRSPLRVGRQRLGRRVHAEWAGLKLGMTERAEIQGSQWRLPSGSPQAVRSTQLRHVWVKTFCPEDPWPDNCGVCYGFAPSL